MSKKNVQWVRVSASSDWKAMDAKWEIAFDADDEQDAINLELYTNAVLDTLPILLGKIGREFTKFEHDPDYRPEAAFEMVKRVSAAIDGA